MEINIDCLNPDPAGLRIFFTVFGLSGNGHVDGGRSTWKFPFALNLVSKSLVPKLMTLVTVSIFFS